MLRVDIGALQMNTGTPDANGSLWYVTDIQGWDSPDLRSNTIGPSSKQGVVISQAMLGGRTMIISGVTKTNSEADFWDAYNSLLGETSTLFTPITMKVYEATGTKQIGVVRGGLPRLQIFPGSIQWQITMMAPDPLKYADTAVTQAMPTATGYTWTNDGTFPTFNIVATTTGAGTVSLTESSSGMSVSSGSDSLPSGTVIDFRAQTVYSGTTDNYAMLTPASAFFGLNPGSVTVTRGGTAPLNFVVRPAWI